MWFKNLQLYRLPSPWPMELAQLDEQLQRQKFQACGSQDMISLGWLAPRTTGQWVHSVGGQWLISLGVEQKLLPSSVVNQIAQERAEEIEAQQGYPLGRKQLKELKERVTEELLPRAFARRRKVYAWIDPVDGWLAIDASSPSKAEEVLETMGKCLDNLAVKPLHTQRAPSSAMADWLAGGEAPSGFTIDRDCELKSVDEEKAAVRYVRHPLEGDEISQEIRAHLADGKLPTRLALTWGEKISFILTEKLEVKRLEFLDLMKEEAEKAAENADEQFDADFALMTGELQRFLPDLMEALGGEITEHASPEAPAPIQPKALSQTGATVPSRSAGPAVTGSEYQPDLKNDDSPPF